jgi:hypothetical protein
MCFVRYCDKRLIYIYIYIWPGSCIVWSTIKLVFATSPLNTQHWVIYWGRICLSWNYPSTTSSCDLLLLWYSIIQIYNFRSSRARKQWNLPDDSKAFVRGQFKISIILLSREVFPQCPQYHVIFLTRKVSINVNNSVFQ